MEVLEQLYEGGVLSLIPQGDFVSENCSTLRSKITESLEGTFQEVIIDLENTQRMDAAGVGLLIAAYTQLKAKFTPIRVINANSDIVDLLKSMCIDQHISIS